MLAGDRDEAVHGFARQHAAGRVVGIADRHHLRAAGDGLAHVVEIRNPAEFLAQHNFLHRHADGARPTPDLQVVRHEHHQLVAGLEQRHHEKKVRLRRSVGDDHMVRIAVRMEVRDSLPQLHAAVRPAIAELYVEQLFLLLGCEKLAQGIGMHATVGEVVLDGVFVERLDALEREFFDLHDIPAEQAIWATSSSIEDLDLKV